MKKTAIIILLLTLPTVGCSFLRSEKSQEVVDKVKKEANEMINQKGKNAVKKIKKEGKEAVEKITGISAVRTKQEVDSTLAKIRAKALYNQKLAEGVDFSSGPCLSNDLMPDWVADIAHNPRVAEDNLPKNQCSAFREGKARHFIELDLNGNLIRSY